MRGRGFTLIELLVALFISAVIFAIGYGALQQALVNRSAVQENQDRLHALVNTMRIVSQDFGQLAPRATRSLVGDGADPALLADGRTDVLVTFTRMGWANPAGIQRPALQRVRYALDDGTLYREHWRVLDPVLGAEPVRRKLIDHVKSVRLRFMENGRSWTEQWPGLVTGGDVRQPLLRRRPIAVEVTLELEDFGTVTRLIEVPG
ncbi:MAG: type II secretion system minor pseudopilin GspJ [Steroidobacteraceae bacterium]